MNSRTDLQARFVAELGSPKVSDERFTNIVTEYFGEDAKYKFLEDILADASTEEIERLAKDWPTPMKLKIVK